MEIEVRALGRFRVVRNGVVMPRSAWQSKKARDLLALVVCRFGRACARDVLIESLWPDEDRRKTGNRLSVALSAVRHALDPERIYSPDHFLAASREAVRLDHGRLAVDADRFRAMAESGLAAARAGRREVALERLEAADAAYVGDLLEEDLYAEWAVLPREHLRLLWKQVARALADLISEPLGSARHLVRVLERDDYDEDAHLTLVDALTRAGAHGDARLAYRRYSVRMAEIGVEPVPRMAALHPEPRDVRLGRHVCGCQLAAGTRVRRTGESFSKGAVVR